MPITGLFSAVRRRLGGQRGEELSYEGWANELQEELRACRDERIATDIDFGKYGDAHSQVILAIGGETLLNKAVNFVSKLTDEERIKPQPEEEEDANDPEAPPKYEDSQENRAFAEKNLRDLQEKLKVLEDLMADHPEPEPVKKKKDQVQAPPEGYEEEGLLVDTESLEVSHPSEPPAVDRSDKPDISAEEIAEKAAEVLEKEEKQEEEAVKSEEVKEEDAKSDEPAVTLEAPPTEDSIKVESDELKKSDNDKDTDSTEMSIEKKEAEVIAAAKFQVSEDGGPDDLPPTYEETTKKEESSFTAFPDLGDLPSIPALVNFFYTGELLISKRNRSDLMDLASEFSLPLIITGCEEYDKMLGPDKDEESDISGIRYKHRNHKEAAQFLHLALNAQWRQQKTLQTDTETKSDLSWSHFDNVIAHRFILASVSGFFKKQIEDDVVDLDLSAGASKELFEKIVNFLYSGTISNVTQTIARELLILCAELDIKRLSDILIDWLINRIRPENCIELQLLGSNHEIASLTERARSFTLKNFIAVAKTDAFKELPADWLVDYVRDNDIEIEFPASKGEVNLFNLVKRWADANATERADDFADVVTKAIRFDLITLSDLEEVISKDIMVIGSAKVTEVVAQVIKNKTNNCVPCGNMRGAESLVITGGSVPIIDEFKGGIYDGEDHHVYDNAVVALHPKTFTTNTIARMPEKLCLHQCVVVGPCLYIAGGFDSFSVIIDEVWRLDLTDGTWKKLPPMKSPRACFQLVALGEYLFALGGLTPAGYTRSMERFEMMTEEWEFTAPLKESLHRHAACITQQGKIIVSGGITSTRETGIEDVFEYNPDFDNWMERAPMNNRRDSHAMIAHGSKVFVVGGQEQTRAGVEVYNTKFNTWLELMTAPRIQYMSACGMADKKIFMVGGWENDTESLDVVASYDYENDEWCEEGEMGLARGSADAAAIRLPRLYWSNKLFKSQ